MKEISDYRKYKWFYTSSDFLVVGGKSAFQNDELVTRMKSINKNYIVMHTSEPGSPFCILLADSNDLSKKDLNECAIFTGCFSRAWKLGKKKMKIDIFKLSQLYKSKDMKTGTWGVLGDVISTTIEPKLVLTFQKGILKAVPETAANKKEILVYLCPGKISKEDMPTKLELELDQDLNQEQILSALPAGGFRICR